MTTTSSRAAAFACALLATTSLASPAYAQVTQTVVVPPQTAVVSPGGVDMATGQYRDETTDLSIGPDGVGGISFTRVNEMGRAFRSNWHFYIKQRAERESTDIAESFFSIESRAISKTYFTGDGISFFDTGLQGGPVEKFTRAASGSGYRFTYTAPDGTTTRFEETSTGGNAVADLITHPNGVVYTLIYDDGGAAPTRRLRRVRSNTGYELILEYGWSGNNDAITKVCVFNTAVIAPPSSPVCPASAPTVSYTYSDFRTASITDAAGAVSTITHNSTATGGRQETLHKPCRPAPCTGEAYLTNTYEAQNGLPLVAVVQQDFADGRTITYSYERQGLEPGDTIDPEPGSRVRGTGWVENGQHTTQVGWSWVQQYVDTPLYISPTPTFVSDPLGRVTNIGYQQGGYSQFARISHRQIPGGRTEQFGYDAGNLVSRTWQPVSGSSEVAITLSYTYDCSVAINCAKPVTATDARGNTTNYSYDPTHGGLLTETLSAVNSVRPQKRYSYSPFYARYYNSSGTLVQSGPIYLLTVISECKTGAASGNGCAVVGDEVRTTFEYGPSTGPNNLLLRGTVVDAGGLSLRTCYAYDAQGNRISETKPKGTGSTCS